MLHTHRCRLFRWESVAIFSPLLSRYAPPAAVQGSGTPALDVSLEASVDYEMALAKCSAEHTTYCRGKSALQLAIDMLRSEGSAESNEKLKRVFGDAPGEDGWDVILHGLRTGSTNGAAFVIYDIVESMQMAKVYKDCLHNAQEATMLLLSNPQDVMSSFFGPLNFDVEEEANIISLLNFSEDDDLDMMRPSERIPDAIMMFLKLPTQKSYVLRRLAHQRRLALLGDIAPVLRTELPRSDPRAVRPVIVFKK